LRFDNRNDPFSPNAGSYLEMAFEQGWGSFTFPKATIEGRQHWTTGSRPDGSGKRVLTLRGFYGVTGTDTPLYEKFFAGDFRSMRGFAYRGVGPFIYNSNIGGVMTALGSLEWQFPWTANDKLQQVVFTDFGTVVNDYSFSTFRMAVGTGLRIYLPQQMFGPLPLAFDIAVPVVKGPDDRERLFTFFIGAFW
jgi:outer membrane protein insertion porin family